MAEYTSINMSPVRRRTPIGMNVNAFADAIIKLDAKYQDAAKQQSAIDMALAQLPVNAAEDEWRANLSDEVTAQINAIENPSDRLIAATKLAGSVINRPDVIGRIRAQAEYDNFIKQTQARNDIDQRTKNWAIETNPYKYEDLRDDSGRIVGGTEWKANNTPVSQVDLSKLATLAADWAKPDMYKGSKATFVNSKGEFTDTYSADVVDMAYQTEEGWQRVGKDKLEQAINAAIDMTPGARASIAQDYNVAIWDYNKLSAEQKANIGGSEITDTNGRLLTEKEFLAKKINPWLDAAAWSNSENEITFGNGIQIAYGLRQQANLAMNEQIQGKVFSPVGSGYVVTQDLSDDINRANGALEDAIKNIEGAAPSLARMKTWREAVFTKNYGEIENIVKNTLMKNNTKYYDALTPEAKRIVDNSLRTIYSNKDFVQHLYKDLDDGTRQALEFVCAVDAGQKNPDNNEFTKTVNHFVSSISGNKPAQKYQIRFNSKEDLDIWLSGMGMSEGAAKKNGLFIGQEDNRPTITFDAGNNFLTKSIVVLGNSNDDLFSNPFKSTEFRALDGNNNIIGTSNRGGFFYNLLSYTSSIASDIQKINTLYNEARAKVDSFNTGTGHLITTNQAVTFEHPAITEARKRGEKQSEINAIQKDVTETLGKAFDGDWAQMTVYGVNDDSKTMTVMDNKDRSNQMHNIKAHIQADKADIQMMQAGSLTGYFVTLHGSMKDGVIRDDGQDISYFVTTGVSDQYLDEFRNDPLTRASINYNCRVKNSGSYRTRLGTNISMIGDDGCLVNGEAASPELGKQLIFIDELMTNLIINPNDQVSAARLLQACNGNQQLIDTINNYLTNN